MGALKENICKVFVFMGSPGSGKGSLAKLCVERFGWKHFSMGDVCREHVAKHTEHGKKIDLILRQGSLVPDDLIVKMANSWLEKWMSVSASIILDGYPRTVLQAKALSKFLQEQGEGSPFVVNFIISDNQVVDRLLYGRLVCSGAECGRIYSAAGDSSLRPQNKFVCDACGSILNRRSDDKEEIIRKRIKVYHKYSSDILSFYNDIGVKVLSLDAGRQLKDVFIDFKRACCDSN